MDTSIAQISANRANAQKSTGPITLAGKNKVSQNAMKYGLFASQLVLEDEDPNEYQSLLIGLQHGLQPVGILEESLVERIAVSLWRQRRLLKAETAQLKLERQPKHIAKAVEQEMYPYYRSGREISEYDLVEIDYEHLQHCRAILDEYNDMDSSVKMSVAEIETALPSMYQHLLQDATANAITPEQTLQRHETTTEYFLRVADYCRDQLFHTTQKQLILDVAKLVKHKRAVLPEKARESLAKYQIMLDNELYKAIKALRETQAWRVNSLPAANELFVLN